jgi:hypothetical protein
MGSKSNVGNCRINLQSGPRPWIDTGHLEQFISEVIHTERMDISRDHV